MPVISITSLWEVMEIGSASPQNVAAAMPCSRDDLPRSRQKIKKGKRFPHLSCWTSTSRSLETSSIINARKTGPQAHEQGQATHDGQIFEKVVHLVDMFHASRDPEVMENQRGGNEV